MEQKAKPVFIISLVRSGSTMLQRILATHSKIASIAEPWILLPLLYTLKRAGTITEYGHYIAYDGVKDMIKNLPGKEKDYFKHINDFTTNLYTSLSTNNEIYFLDKTPRYIFIIPEIAKTFPDAKFIFLFRNPVQVYASILKTWDNGRFRELGIANFFNEVRKGPKILSDGYELLKDKSYAIQYEKFVINPEKYLKEIMNYMELDYEAEMLQKFHKTDLKGVNIDPTGTKAYKKVDESTLKKWESVFSTRYRKSIIKKYVKTLDENALALQGYDKATILKEVEKLKTNGNFNFFRDVYDYNRSKIIAKYSRLNFS